jgi:hypothetical protein
MTVGMGGQALGSFGVVDVFPFSESGRVATLPVDFAAPNSPGSYQLSIVLLETDATGATLRTLATDVATLNVAPPPPPAAPSLVAVGSPTIS